MARSNKLTKRQEQILDFLRSFAQTHGYPPSVREIGDAIGLSSSSTVHSHLQALINKGYIKRDASQARALLVMDENGEPAPMARQVQEIRNVVQLPLIGQVAAGEPILAEQNVEDTLPLPSQVVGDDSSFLLTIRGDSMIDAGIFNGDYVVVREQQTANNGDIVVALIGEEATVKTFYKEDGRVRLQPQNPTMDPIYVKDPLILGKVVALLRTL
jgi:repressor LexA